jgi:basic membrane lipoprotein Med (substrate-binding protein (PBP1-ABC) superfamily)
MSARRLVFGVVLVAAALLCGCAKDRDRPEPAPDVDRASRTDAAAQQPAPPGDLAQATGAGDSAAEPAAPPRDPSKRAMKVALLLTGPISDDGWNASAYEGLTTTQRLLNAQVSYLESLEKSRFEESFRGYASDGYDLVIGHAYEFQDAALRVAPDFPATRFVVIAGNRAEGNVSSISFRLEEATFILGALAASLSKSGKLGLVGGEEIPSLAPGFQGFIAGARSVRPDATVITKYVGSWVDVALGKEHASALISQGVDFIFQNADKAGLGVFQAARENPGVFAFGSNKNQNDVAPDVILASAVIDVPSAISGLASAAREGRFRDGSYALGVREGIVSVEMNPKLADRVPAALTEQLNALQARVAAGELNVLDPSQPVSASAEAHPDWLRR